MPNTQAQVKQLKKLVLADHCFRQVRAFSDHLTSIGLKQFDLIYGPCLTGIVTTYMKPFMQSDGLGQLPSDFRSFPTPLLQHTHDILEEARNKVYAHRDVLAAQALTYDNIPANQPYSLDVVLSKEEPRLTLLPFIPDLNPEIGWDIKELCVFQSERATKKTNDLLASLAAGKQYKAGRYTVGVNFP